MIDLSKFERVITRCEALAAKSPGVYRFRVALLAILGIVTVLFAFVVAVLVVLGIGALAIVSHAVVLLKLAVLPLAFAFAIFRSFWVTMPPPPGVAVTEKTAPRLMAEIAEVRAKLASLKVHRTLISPDRFNAAVVQIPRLGPLGWPRNYLIIGLPLLESLSREEFRAVLGHELGHLSRRQARFRNWIYRSRNMWANLSARLGHGLLGPFLNWYGPYFNAYSFVLARTNEYDADRAAALVSGPQMMARALTATSIKGRYFETTLWVDLTRRAGVEPTPPASPFFDGLRHARALAPQEISAGLQQALAVKTSLTDTHPCLADRLRALGVGPVPPGPVAVSAAEMLLGPLREMLISDTNAKWAKNVAAQWQAANNKGTEERTRLEELTAQAASLDAKGMFEYATLLERHHDPALARRWIDAAIAREPGYAPAMFMRGRLRLAAGEEAGSVDIDEAMRLDPGATEAGSQLLYSHFSSRRDTERSQKYLNNLTAIGQRNQAAAAERRSVTVRDTFAPHGLSAEALKPFQDALAASPKVAEARLARKVLKHVPEKPLYVLAVDGGFLRKIPRPGLQKIANAIPAPLLVLDVRKNPKIGAKIRRTAGSLIYRRT